MKTVADQTLKQNDAYLQALTEIERLDHAIQQFLLSRPASQTAAVLANRYQLARVLSDAVSEAVKPLSTMIGAMNLHDIPEAFENEKISTLTLDTGYRVTVSTLLRASTIDSDNGKKWLRDNGHEYAVTETINASTLAALAKQLLTEGKELPDDIFKVTPMPSVSLTKLKATAKMKKD